MSVSIIECLQNAENNLQSTIPADKQMGLEQLRNAIVLLEKGYSAFVDVDAVIEEYGSVEKARKL